MKRFIIKLLIFAAIFVTIDFSAICIFKLYDYTKGGEIHKVHTLMTKETPELLIVGSSRAAHHLVPSILRDSLNMTVYNGGLDGQGTTIAYGFYKGVNERKSPKMIICEITPAIDLYEGMDPTLNNLYPYLQVDGIEDIITSYDSSERIKLRSNLYRLNSALFRLFPSLILDRKIAEDGYIPSYGQLDINNADSETEQNVQNTNIVPVKERWLRALIEDADTKGIKIIFTISPVYGGSNIEEYTKEIAIIHKYNKPVLNYLNDKRFINNSRYFNDRVHLNHIGAEKFTKTIIKDVKSAV